MLERFTSVIHGSGVPPRGVSRAPRQIPGHAYGGALLQITKFHAKNELIALS